MAAAQNFIPLLWLFRNVCFPCQRIDSSKRDDEEEVSHFTNWHRFRAITHDAEYRKESHRNTCLYLRIAHEVDEHEDTEADEDECEEEVLTVVTREIEHACYDDCEHGVDDKSEKKVKDAA